MLQNMKGFNLKTLERFGLIMYKARIDRIYKRLADPGALHIFAFNFGYYCRLEEYKDEFSVMVLSEGEFVSQQKMSISRFADVLERWPGAHVRIIWEIENVGNFNYDSKAKNEKMPISELIECLRKCEMPREEGFTPFELEETTINGEKNAQNIAF